MSIFDNFWLSVTIHLILLISLLTICTLVIYRDGSNDEEMELEEDSYLEE